MKSVLQIICEEISNYFSDWQSNDEPSLADKYYEKNLGITPTTLKPETNASSDFIGYVDKMGNSPIKPIPVYKNPKNLDNFTSQARGILLSNGDLYLAQSYNALHDNILDLLSEKGIIPYSSKLNYDKEFPEQFVEVQRIFKTNKFAQSMAYDEFPPHYLEIFDMGNKKQPFEFKPFEIPKY